MDSGGPESLHLDCDIDKLLEMNDIVDAKHDNGPAALPDCDVLLDLQIGNPETDFHSCMSAAFVGNGTNEQHHWEPVMHASGSASRLSTCCEIPCHVSCGKQSTHDHAPGNVGNQGRADRDREF